MYVYTSIQIMNLWAPSFFGITFLFDHGITDFYVKMRPTTSDGAAIQHKYLLILLQTHKAMVIHYYLCPSYKMSIINAFLPDPTQRGGVNARHRVVNSKLDRLALT